MNLIDDLDIIQKIVFRSIADISYIIRCNNPTEMSSIIGSDNICGDKIKDLDLKCNDIIKDNLSECALIKSIASEEEEELLDINTDGKYLFSYDPLDGSSNIDSNITIGTIFCIFEYKDGIIKDGGNIVMSGYSLYGGCTQLVICKNDKVMIYMLDPSNDNWILLEDNYKLGYKGNIYSINEANKFIYDNKINNYINNLIEEDYSTRWVGSLVADFHRTLIKAGIVAYPSNKKNKDGRIRLIYEAYPLAHIIEKAGGKSYNGEISFLDVKFPLDNIHEKTPIFYGSYYEMNKLLEFLK